MEDILIIQRGQKNVDLMSDDLNEEGLFSQQNLISCSLDMDDRDFTKMKGQKKKERKKEAPIVTTKAQSKK